MFLDKVSIICFLASYTVALAAELTQFWRRSAATRWATLLFAGAGLVAHTSYLISRSQQHDLPPLLGSTHDWLLVSAWLAMVLYLGVQFWNPQLSLGVFCLPVVVTLVIVSRFVSTSPNPQVGQLYVWSMLHASFWVFGILGVLLAFLVSLMYLAQHYRLKHKRSELPALHLFSLERLSRMNWWLVILSVPMLTLGMITGLWMIYLSKTGTHPVSLLSLTVAVNGAMWVAMAVLFGWMLGAKNPTGRVVAWRTALACLFMILTLFVMKLVSADGIHGPATTPVASSPL
ncbi:hypothetical protein [Planctomicrobium piriforme]|uniref:Cytochrome C assembly protein n=1 Tax=Planctomicrobium piriforme TaxID=1576369 RepID=A0A1I3GYK4_9PLAN|nr:hypothetical protein [Planctomicrobium piriforme]SFI28446.1 Cytochrome C assembly protein [Planctomicrobium piriforme]